MIIPQLDQTIYWESKRGDLIADTIIGIERLKVFKDYSRFFNYDYYKIKVKYHRFDKTYDALFKTSSDEMIIKHWLYHTEEDKYFRGIDIHTNIVVCTDLKEALITCNMYREGLGLLKTKNNIK